MMMGMKRKIPRMTMMGRQKNQPEIASDRLLIFVVALPWALIFHSFRVFRRGLDRRSRRKVDYLRIASKFVWVLSRISFGSDVFSFSREALRSVMTLDAPFAFGTPVE